MPDFSSCLIWMQDGPGCHDMAFKLRTQRNVQRMWSMTPGPSHLSQWGSGSWPPLPWVIPVDGHLCLEHLLLPETLDFKVFLMALGFLNYPKL